jgi:hypothetical protein
MKINHLTVRVNLTHKAVVETLQRHQPVMDFVLPAAPVADAPSFPDQSDDFAGEETVFTNGEAIPPPNPQVIADRVYEIMKQEARMGRLRGEIVRNKP